MKDKVPVQKGKINANPPTNKTTTYGEQQQIRLEQNRMIRDNQLLKLHVPKK